MLKLILTKLVCSRHPLRHPLQHTPQLHQYLLKRHHYIILARRTPSATSPTRTFLPQLNFSNHFNRILQSFYVFFEENILLAPFLVLWGVFGCLDLGLLAEQLGQLIFGGGFLLRYIEQLFFLKTRVLIKIVVLNIDLMLIQDILLLPQLSENLLEAMQTAKLLILAVFPRRLQQLSCLICHVETGGRDTHIC